MALGLLLNEPVAAVVILIMLTGGEALEDYAMSRAESGIHELLEQEQLSGDTEHLADYWMEPCKGLRANKIIGGYARCIFV